MEEKQIILFFIKAPIKGGVKSRLAADIKEDHALELYKNFILDMLEMLRQVDRPLRICYYPASTGEAIAKWLGPRYQYEPQYGSNLGERMENALRNAFRDGFINAVLIGSDLPDLTAAVIRQAFAKLDTNDLVLGPARDGGYYLLGAKKDSFPGDIFHGVPWSTTAVLRMTVEKIKAARRSFYQIPEWRDVDDLSDLHALFERNLRSEFNKSRTMEYLSKNRKVLFHGLNDGRKKS